MKRNLLILLALCSVLLMVVSTASAQVPGGPDDECRDAAGGIIECPDEGGTNVEDEDGGDRDGDGTADGLDVCPDASGHARLSGCPDIDEDNTPDIIDLCPTIGGPDTNNGCPIDESAATAVPAEPTEVPAADLIAPPVSDTGRCLLGTLRNAPVNVRNAPNANAAVIGAINPGQGYPILHIWIAADGAWYRVGSPDGWVFSGVVQTAGDCTGVATSDFSNPGATGGAVPNWGPNGELTFCQPNYELGEDTCIPDATGGNVVPNWGPNGEITFCQPQFDLGEDTCMVLPEGGAPHFNHLGDLLYCVQNEIGEDDCVVIETAEDGGIIMCALRGRPQTIVNNTGSIAPNPCVQRHKFLLVGEDGLIVLTDTPSTDPTEGDSVPMDPFSLNFAACAPEEGCSVKLVSALDPELPFAACYFDQTSPEVEACDTDNLAGRVVLQDFHITGVRVVLIPFNPDLPLAACYYDPVTNPEVEACDTDNLMGGVFNPDLPIAACFYDQTSPEVEACDTDDLGQTFDPDLPLAACAYDNDKLIQCSTNDLGDVEGDSIVLINAEPSTTQTREHILLARQVNLPALLDENPDGGLLLDLTSGGDDPVGIGLLLPAVQKVREAAAR